MCGQCHHFRINGRPWCPSCAARELPRPTPPLLDNLYVILKIAVVAGVILGISRIEILGTMSQGLVMAVALTVIFKFWIFRKVGESGPRVEELVNGRDVRADGAVSGDDARLGGGLPLRIALIATPLALWIGYQAWVSRAWYGAPREVAWVSQDLELLTIQLPEPAHDAGRVETGKCAGLTCFEPTLTHFASHRDPDGAGYYLAGYLEWDLPPGVLPPEVMLKVARRDLLESLERTLRRLPKITAEELRTLGELEAEEVTIEVPAEGFPFRRALAARARLIPASCHVVIVAAAVPAHDSAGEAITAFFDRLDIVAPETNCRGATMPAELE